MQVSPYETQYTRQMRTGHKDPSRDMKNGVALGKPLRKKLWQQRQAEDTKS